MLLTVLAPFAQLAVYEVALPAHIRHYWGVPIAALVGAGYPFLFRLRVVAGGHVDVHRDETAGEP